MTDEPSRSGLVVAGRLTAVAFELLGSIAAGAFIGWWVDGWLGTQPAALIGLTLLGTTAGFYRMIQMLRHFQHRLRKP